jgi:hypothetical protein
MKSILHGMKRTGVSVGSGPLQKKHDDSFVVADELKKTAKPKAKGQTKMTDF